MACRQQMTCTALVSSTDYLVADRVHTCFYVRVDVLACWGALLDAGFLQVACDAAWCLLLL
jgi:hypothetical protein